MAVEPEQRPPPDLSLARRPHARSDKRPPGALGSCLLPFPGNRQDLTLTFWEYTAPPRRGLPIRARLK